MKSHWSPSGLAGTAPLVAANPSSASHTRESMKARARRIAKKSFLQFFATCDRIGVHVLPRHYYSPVSELSWLTRNKEVWAGRLNLHGIDWNLARQLDWLDRVCAPYYDEVRGLHLYNKLASQGWGPGFGAIESQVLYCFIRSERPRRIIEVGSGVSTACMCEAVRRNRQDGLEGTEITCVEPFPGPAFSQLSRIRHIAQMCQAVPTAVFSELKPGDFLFIDSTHAVKTGSDVIRIYLDIIPCLPPGVVIHIHDVYLPFAYPRDALSHFFGWQETALLSALLTGNSRLSILTCLSAMHYDRAMEMQRILTDYVPQLNDHGLQPASGPLDGHFPSSIWLRTH